ncbi:MAG: putative deoxyribonuclease RhsC [Chlamydiae bacterium]|nr:putative deoxyribonuclease RhsC [Chlamydiota bacterium]
MQLLIYSLLLLVSTLFSNEASTPMELASLQGDSSSLICGCVSAITGDFIYRQNDIEIKGTEPIPIHRTYISSEIKNPNLRWHLLYHGGATATVIGPSIFVSMPEPNGVFLLYKPIEKVVDIEELRKKKNVPIQTPVICHPAKSSFQSGIVNRPGNSPVRNKVEFSNQKLKVIQPDGSFRLYHKCAEKDSQSTQTIFYLLNQEQLSNGQRIHYNWNKKRKLEKIWTTNPSGSKTFATTKVKYADAQMKILTSDHHELTYEFSEKEIPKKYRRGSKKGRFLKTAKTTDYPKEKLKRNKELLLEERAFPDKRILGLEYDKEGRVSKIKYPKNIHYRLEYYPNRGLTIAIAPNREQTHYYFDPSTLRLDKIKYLDQGTGHLKSEIFTWNKEGYLQSKKILNKEETPLLSIFYAYDSLYNLKKKTLTGKISCQNAEEESYSTDYSYDTLNRLALEREENGLTTSYSYLNTTTLPTKKCISRHGVTIKRTLYEYDQDNILIREIIDDGEDFSERKIKKIYPRSSEPYYGLPEVIEEFYLEESEEKLIKKTQLFYDRWGNIEKKTIFDANDTERYTLVTQYNEKGQIVREWDACENLTQYKYDKNGNKILEITPLGLTIQYEYDSCNRLVKKTESSPTQEHVANYKNYGYKDQPSEIIDQLGGCTRNTYDSFGNLIKTTDDRNATETYEYNILGHQISTTDPRHHKTTTVYNIYGSPLLIEYPDNTSETFTYNLDGTQATHTNQNGITTKYFYDEFGNIAREEIFDQTENLIGEITRKYNAFHLLEETNLEGYKTTYEYNASGQLMRQTYEGQTTTYAYDSLGRRIQDTTEDYTLEKTYDLLNRIISERELFNTETLTETHIEYAPNNQHKTVTNFPNNKPASTYTEYDAFGREIKTIDPLGHETTTQYIFGNKTLKKIITEPGNIQVTETYNSLDQLLSIEKQNLYRQTIALTRYDYDLSGNQILEETTIYKDTSATSTHTVQCTYDSLNRKETETESSLRTAKYTYTPTGLLHTFEKPDGIQLIHTYDALGYPQSLISSKNDIHYVYSYNRLGYLISSRDLIHNTQTSRIVDPHGNILQETLANGYILTSEYDSQGSRRSLVLPNNKTISYSYQGPYLDTLSCGNLSFTYSYDHDGNLIDNTLTTLTYDSLSRPEILESPHFSQQCTFDPRGNITSIQSTQQLREFTYDDHDHLKQEPNHIYSYDSLHNRISKNNASYNLNSLNQIQSPDLEYDPNGNLIRSGDTYFSYDSLDRLIEVKTPTQSFTYVYDSEHRRLSKNNTHYIWDGNHELGTLDEYRILGPTPTAEIASAIIHYINDEPYLPIHDLQGNLIQLLTPERELALEQDFTAFGEGQSKLSWGFSSKRHDPETGLIYFGRRFYNPTLGRFITTDPEGYTNSANLYAYCQNNPLIYQDPYGLMIASPTINLLLDEDMHQAAAGMIHGITTPVMNTGYELTKYTDFFATSLLHPFTNNGLSLTETLQAKDMYWEQEKAFSSHTLRNMLGGDSQNPYFNLSQSNFRASADLALIMTPFGRVKTIGSAASKALTASKIIPEAPSTLKAMNVSRRIFQSNKTSYSMKFNPTLNRIKSMLISAQEKYKGSTRVGYALSKHAGRNPTTWGKIKGPMKDWNKSGLAHLKNIYRSEGSFELVNNPKTGLVFFEKRLNDGRGLRLNQDYTFKGFID